MGPQRPPAAGTVVVMLSSASGDSLRPTSLRLGGSRLALAGEVPRAPQMRRVGQLSLDPGTYPLQLDGVSLPGAVRVVSGQVEPVLLAVADGRIGVGGVYAGSDDLNLGLSELGGGLTALPDFRLTDQDGAPLVAASLLGRDTVIAAFHTTCRETCPLYTGLLAQLRKRAPEVRLVEVTTDPATDTPAVLASLRTLARASAPAGGGGPAPSFDLPTTDGRSLSLEELRGRPVVINFWYAGCPPCQQEMPLLQRAADQHPGVAVLLVNYRDAAGTARDFARRRQIRAPVLLDEDGRVAASYRVSGFPTTVFVRADGTEEGRQPGALTDSALSANLSNLGAG